MSAHSVSGTLSWDDNFPTFNVYVKSDDDLGTSTRNVTFSANSGDIILSCYVSDFSGKVLMPTSFVTNGNGEPISVTYNGVANPVDCKLICLHRD